MQVLLIALALATGLALSHFLLKYSVSVGTGSFAEQLTAHWLIILGALLIYAIIFFYYLYALRAHSLAVLFPVYTGLSVVFVAVVGKMFFDEPLDIRQIAGISLICLGVILMGWVDTSA